jgi:Kef-type K+ transport system membrane component KefB
VSLLAVAVIALVLSQIPRLGRGGRLAQVLREGQHAAAQTTLRWTVVMLLLLLLIANRFGLDAVLGAFLAGVVLRRWAPGDVHSLEEKLDAVGYGFFIPIFFVASGMSLDLRSIVQSPGRLILFFVLLLLVRGLPTLLIYRSALARPEHFELLFLLATALPLLVALSEIGLQSGTMLPENAAAPVGAGVLSVLVFRRSRHRSTGVVPHRLRQLPMLRLPGLPETSRRLLAYDWQKAGVGASRLELLTPSCKGTAIRPTSSALVRPTLSERFRALREPCRTSANRPLWLHTWLHSNPARREAPRSTNP